MSSCWLSYSKKPWPLICNNLNSPEKTFHKNWVDPVMQWNISTHWIFLELLNLFLLLGNTQLLYLSSFKLIKWTCGLQTVASLHIQKLQSNVWIHWQSGFSPPFSFVLGIYHHLRKISGSLASKLPTMFASLLLSVSVLCLELSEYCAVGF